MRHHTVAQKGEGGGWHYVSLHPRRGGYPIGFCADHEPHATEAEARECYGEYQRSRVRLDNTLSDWSGCKVCDAPTKTAAAQGGFRLAPLCAEHLTQEHAVVALGIDGPAGDSWQS